MFKKIFKENMGKSDLGWLKSNFHFSFAEYRNPNNINFGNLRVLNDDLIAPNSGFETHPHKNMEIITYVIDGELTHKDSMGNDEILCRGEVQYLSAGDGIYHSEHNLHNEKILRLLQIWIIPPENSLPKLYGSYKFKKEQRDNKLLKIVSSKNSDAPIKIYQDVNIYVSELEEDLPLEFQISSARQLYFVQIEGSSLIGESILENGDAMQIINENLIIIKAVKKSHFLFIEMENPNKA